MSFLFRKVEDVTTISKSQSLTSVSIKDFVFTYSFFPFHILADFTYLQISSTCTCLNEDCFYCCSYRNNVVFLFGTLKVQSFMLTEVRDCALLIVVTSSTFLKMMMIAFIITLGEIM